MKGILWRDTLHGQNNIYSESSKGTPGDETVKSGTTRLGYKEYNSILISYLKLM